MCGFPKYGDFSNRLNFETINPEIKLKRQEERLKKQNEEMARMKEEMSRMYKLINENKK